jgi:hypothetical protein
MDDQLATKLNSLGFELPKWCQSPSETLVREYEKLFSLQLPADYRNFLVQHGGIWVSGGVECPFLEPTPCGTGAYIDAFFGFTAPNRSDNVSKQTKHIDGYPDVVAIGDNLMGQMFWLKCLGRDTGHVYMYDHESRSAWPDEMFSQMFQNLAPSIREYLELRKLGMLPKKPKGYEHIYLVAKSFGEFIDSLKKPERED